MARLRCLNPEDFAETNRPLLALRRHSSPGYAVGLYRVSTAEQGQSGRASKSGRRQCGATLRASGGCW